MKEITQAHIARVPYNIERDAYKELQAYLHALGAVAAKDHHTDLVDEVESRIVEILASRGVKRDGIITAKEVSAIREQLGEPHDFATEESDSKPEESQTASGDAVPTAGEQGFFKRRLYRDEKRGIIAGVCYGIAKVLDIDPLWVRLAFLVLIVVSQGAGIIVYLILAILMPNVKTDADRLQMEGKPVNVQSLQWFKSEQAQTTASHIRNIWEQFRYLIARAFRLAAAGVVFVAGLSIIIGLLMLFSVLASMLGGADKDWFGTPLVSNHWFVAATVIAGLVSIVALVLLVAVAIKVALVDFGLRVKGDNQLSRRVALVCAAILGLSLLTVLGTTYPTAREVSNAVEQNSHTMSQVLSPQINTVDLRTAASVEIRQDSTNPRVEVRQAVPNRARIKPLITESNGTISVRDTGTDCTYMCFGGMPTVTIYTATPPNVTTKDTNFVNIYGAVNMLTIDASDGNLMGINAHGVVHELHALIGGGGFLDMTGATITKAALTYPGGTSATVRLGNIPELAITDAMTTHACWANNPADPISLYDQMAYPLSIPSFGKLTLNGTDVTSQVTVPQQKYVDGVPQPANTVPGCFTILRANN